jgi:hypothetical protein
MPTYAYELQCVPVSYEDGIGPDKEFGAEPYCA